MHAAVQGVTQPRCKYAGHDSALYVSICSVNPLSDNSVVYNIFKFSGQVDSGHKVHIIYGSWKGSNTDSHSDEILSLAISSDGKFLVSRHLVT